MEEFALKHPWLTFFGGLVVLNTISWTAWGVAQAAKGAPTLGAPRPVTNPMQATLIAFNRRMRGGA